MVLRKGGKIAFQAIVSSIVITITSQKNNAAGIKRASSLPRDTSQIMERIVQIIPPTRERAKTTALSVSTLTIPFVRLSQPRGDILPRGSLPAYPHLKLARVYGWRCRQFLLTRRTTLDLIRTLGVSSRRLRRRLPPATLVLRIRLAIQEFRRYAKCRPCYTTTEAFGETPVDFLL